MDTLKTITSRRSIRHYTQKKVDADELLFLVEMGMKAPSAGNLQDFRFIVCDEEDIIRKLPKLCMDQEWITEAPAIIVVCSQPDKQAKWFGEKGRHIFATQNAAAAAQNILLAAHAQGYGACWISGFDQQAVDELFGAEGKGRVEVIITIGHPNEKPDRKDEIGLEVMAYFNKFGNNKRHPELLNKDYSILLEKKLKKIEPKIETFSEIAKSKICEFTNQIKNQIHKK